MVLGDPEILSFQTVCTVDYDVIYIYKMDHLNTTISMYYKYVFIYRFIYSKKAIITWYTIRRAVMANVQ